MTGEDTRQFMALVSIWQHFGRPGTPTDQAHIESFFSHLIFDYPHLDHINDPVVLSTELARIRIEYNEIRLHAGVGYVTPNDEHEGRGPAIRRARARGLKQARQNRINHNRNPNKPPEQPS
jgi:transposase InsO family protein